MHAARLANCDVSQSVVAYCKVRLVGELRVISPLIRLLEVSEVGYLTGVTAGDVGCRGAGDAAI